MVESEPTSYLFETLPDGFLAVILTSYIFLLTIVRNGMVTQKTPLFRLMGVDFLNSTILNLNLDSLLLMDEIKSFWTLSRMTMIPSFLLQSGYLGVPTLDSQQRHSRTLRFMEPDSLG